MPSSRHGAIFGLPPAGDDYKEATDDNGAMPPSRWSSYAVVVLVASAMLEASLRSDGDPTAAILLNVAATAPLIFWRRGLVWIAPIVTAATFSLVADVAPMTVSAFVAQLVVVYLAAERPRGGRVLAALLVLPYAGNAIEPIGGDDATIPGILLFALVGAAAVVGDGRRERREAIAERDASREAVEHALRAQGALEERTLIARELHDIVAHHVSRIAVQAETARLTTPGLPDLGEQRFGEIATSAREALGDMRRLLGVLRADVAARHPQPGLEQLEELIDAARASGTSVRLQLRGPVVTLPAGIDLSAYRILQEALTNARRHAPTADVDVELRFEPDTLHLCVRDNGPGPVDTGRIGQGLLGMHERAALVGGTLRTGPGSRGGFTVEAELPITQETS
jgi:signal transduction histidine kinase